MTARLEKLPEEKDALKQIILDLQEVNGELQNKLNSLQSANEALTIYSEQEKISLEQKIEYLRFQLMKALKKHYGRSSERMVSNAQLSLPLFDEAVVEEPEFIEKAEEEITVASYTRRKSGRRPLPDWLPRKQVIHDLEEGHKICECGHPLHRIGEEKSEQLEYVPAKATVIEHIKYKYACRACENGVKTAELPKQLIPKSIATPGLLAHVVISKFEDHLPLYRQEHIWQRIGIDIPRSTLCNWVLKSGEGVLSLIELLKEDLVAGNYTQGDETYVQVLEQEGKSATSKSYMGF